MAKATTGTHVNFVKVSTMKNFNDLTNNGKNTAGGTIYFIVDEKKIHLDGVMYGFNDGDIDLTPFLQHDGSVPMSGTLDFNSNNLDNVYQISSESKDQNGSVKDTIEFNDGGVGISVKDEDGKLQSWIQFDPNGIHMSGGAFLGLDGLTPFGNEILLNTDNDNHAVSIKTLKNVVTSQKGVKNGYASLDKTGKVPSGQLPSYVDDIMEFANQKSFPAVGDAAKLYVDLTNSFMYRWGGSAYYNVSDGNAPLKLGTTESTAYYGDKGQEAYDHSLLKSGNPHGVTATDLKLGSVKNYGIASTAEAKAGSSSTKYMTPERTKEAIVELAPRLTWEVK